MDGPYLKGFLDPVPNTIINEEMSLKWNMNYYIKVKINSVLKMFTIVIYKDDINLSFFLSYIANQFLFFNITIGFDFSSEVIDWISLQ